VYPSGVLAKHSPLEGRGEQTDGLVEGDMSVHRDRARMSTELDRIAELARGQKEVQFTSIAHLLTVAALDRAYHSLRKEASVGVDGVTYGEYGAHAREKLLVAYPLQRPYIARPWASAVSHV
jgi:hypothetical protein